MIANEGNFCSRCGAQLTPQARFCEECGAPVVVLSQPAPVIASTAPEAAPKKSSCSTLWVGIALLVVAACGVLMIVLYYLL